MINRGAEPVDGGDPEIAAANIVVFVDLVREQAAREGQTRGFSPAVGESRRDPDADQGGRFGWILPVNGTDVRILMPGVDLDQLRSLQASAPTVIVGGEPNWWSGAVLSAVVLPRR